MAASNYTIHFLYENYRHAMNIIETRYNHDEYDTFSDFWHDKEHIQNVYVHAMELAFEKPDLSYAHFAPVDVFIQEARGGSFNKYDGIGYWLDWDGNEISGIGWDETSQMPKNAVFVAWYNK